MAAPLADNQAVELPPTEILAHWRLDAGDIEVIDVGRNSRHWKASSPTGPVTLRCFGPDTASEDADFEIGVLGALSRSGVMVPVPIPVVGTAPSYVVAS